MKLLLWRDLNFRTFDISGTTISGGTSVYNEDHGMAYWKEVSIGGGYHTDFNQFSGSGEILFYHLNTLKSVISMPAIYRKAVGSVAGDKIVYFLEYNSEEGDLDQLIVFDYNTEVLSNEQYTEFRSDLIDNLLQTEIIGLSNTHFVVCMSRVKYEGRVIGGALLYEINPDNTATYINTIVIKDQIRGIGIHEGCRINDTSFVVCYQLSDVIEDEYLYTECTKFSIEEYI